ncbi:MAG: hypothetical protein QXW80_01205 [Candidatus Micrarchaeia archaeon]
MIDSKKLDQLRFAARYPFSKTAKQILSQSSFKIDYEKIQFAKKRIMEALFDEKVSVLVIGDESTYEKYLVSYPLSRMIISLFDSQVRNKFINNEVKRALANITADNPDYIEEAKRVARDMDIELDGLNISVEKYLLYVPKTEEGRLVFQNLKGGKILLNEATFMSFISEVIRQNIESGIPIPKENFPKEILSNIEQVAKEIEAEVNKRREAKEKVAVMFAKSTGEIAPCMAKILERARNGENLPHFARVAIASYLLKRGKSIDEVVEVFTNTPNFDEKIARYQVEFIAKKGYNPPSCQMMESYGLRLPECGCLGEKGHRNPLQYGTRLIKRSRLRVSKKS